MSEWTESFETYFKFKNYMWKIEQDGAGANERTRPCKLQKKKLLADLYNNQRSREEAFDLINIIGCLDFNPFCDL